MALLERQAGRLHEVDDRFVFVEDEAELPDGPVIVSLPRFEKQRDALRARNDALGVWLDADESPKSIAQDLGDLAVVALNFPAFSDGRAFSYARLLRERYGYRGQVRAIGEVMLEQIPFMIRSGFDAFEPKDVDDVETLEAVCEEVRVVYQPTSDGQVTAIQRRIGR